MTTDNARHQKKWRDRLLVQAKYFRELDDRRFSYTDAPLAAEYCLPTCRPEASALVKFFWAYPMCRNMPVALDLNTEEGCWVVTFEDDTHIDIAAAHMALREVSSLPVKTIRADGNWTCLDKHGDKSPAVTGSLTEHWMQKIAPDVKELRDLDLWNRGE